MTVEQTRARVVCGKVHVDHGLRCHENGVLGWASKLLACNARHSKRVAMQMEWMVVHAAVVETQPVEPAWREYRCIRLRIAISIQEPSFRRAVAAKPGFNDDRQDFGCHVGVVVLNAWSCEVLVLPIQSFRLVEARCPARA